MSWSVNVTGDANTVSERFARESLLKREEVTKGHSPAAETADIDNAGIRAVDIAHDLSGSVEVSAGGSWHRTDTTDWARGSFYLTVRAVG